MLLFFNIESMSMYNVVCLAVYVFVFLPNSSTINNRQLPSSGSYVYRYFLQGLAQMSGSCRP